MEQKGFTKDCTLMTKGILIMLMLVHHLFYGDTMECKGILTLFDPNLVMNWQRYGKVCVSGFLFLSAYGITRQLMTTGEDFAQSAKQICARRLLKLESTCLFIYPLAVLYRKFIAHQPVKEIYYMAEERFQPVFMLLDALGLADFFNTPKLNVTWWYLSLAILLILALPLLFWLYRKIGFWLFLGSLFLFEDKMVASAVFGIACACDGVFEKLEEKLEVSAKRRVGGLVIGGALLWLSFEISSYSDSVEKIQWVTGALISFLVMMYISKIPLLAPILKLLGRHSANIFLIHTFIFSYFYEDFIYSFQWAGLIFPVLLACSLGVSLVLEMLKKLLSYDRLIAKADKLLCDKIFS